MTAGLRRKRVTFQQKTKVPDGGGGFAPGWSDVVSPIVRFQPERGRERVESGRVSAELTGILTVRSSKKTRTITEAHRVLIHKVPYQIRSISNPDQRNRDLEMTVERGAAQGD